MTDNNIVDSNRQDNEVSPSNDTTTGNVLHKDANGNDAVTESTTEIDNNATTTTATVVDRGFLDDCKKTSDYITGSLNDVVLLLLIIAIGIYILCGLTIDNIISRYFRGR